MSTDGLGRRNPIWSCVCYLINVSHDGSMGRWYIYLYMKTIKIKPNVGKYTSPMDGMGLEGCTSCLYSVQLNNRSPLPKSPPGKKIMNDINSNKHGNGISHDE